MTTARLTVVALGMCLALLPSCTTGSPPVGGAQTDSVQFLYRSSGFPESESFASIVLVLEKQTALSGERFVLVATLGYNDIPEPNSLVIAADSQAAVLKDDHPRTARRLIGAPRFSTRASFPLDQGLLGRLARAERIVVECGGLRITLSDRERRVVQGFLVPGGGS